MPDMPNIGLGTFSMVNRGHETKALKLNALQAGVLERRPAQDRVELSSSAHRIIESKEVRQDLVERIRQQIADGSYESEQRLTDATERLLRELEA